MLLNTDKIIAKEAKTSVTDAGYCHLSFSPIYYTIKQIKMTTALPCPNVYGPSGGQFTAHLLFPALARLLLVSAFFFSALRINLWREFI